jgi:hypothetical protein
MNRPFPRFEVLGLTAALALAGACTPNTSVKPGAPMLIELSVVENGGATITTVTPTTERCPTPTLEGGPCDSVKFPACESVTTTNLCRCVPNPPPPPPPPPPADAAAPDAATLDAAAATSDAGKPDAGKPDAGAATSDAAPPMLTGTWSCSFAPTSTVLYVFDRVLDTEFLGDGGGALGLATISSIPTPPSSVVLNGDYASNGTFNIIFTDPNQLADFRADGPSILFAAVPALPTSSTINVTLDKTRVLAKDGRTPYAGTNLLVDGTISFVTQGFSASITSPSMAPVTVTFTNVVDPTALAGHITVTATPLAGGASAVIPVDLTSMDGLNVNVAPSGKTADGMPLDWPADSTVDIKVDATTPDVVGDTLGADLSASLTTSAM